MAGRLLLVVAALSVALASAASAATRDTGPDASTTTLQASDFPGSHASGSAIPGLGSTASGYLRAIKLAKPYGASKFTVIISFSFVTGNVPTAVQLYHLLGRQLSSKQSRLSLVKSFLGGAGLKIKPSAVTMKAPQALGIPDSSMEMGFVVKYGNKRLNLAVTALRLDRVVDVTEAAGTGHAVASADDLALTKLAASHIAAALVPASSALPTITGAAAQGQTLTSTTGTWTNTPTAYAEQWERCDTSGANCVAIPGATSATYTSTAADAGSTLRVAVTATNRFGSATATSAQTSTVT